MIQFVMAGENKRYWKKDVTMCAGSKKMSDEMR